MIPEWAWFTRTNMNTLSVLEATVDLSQKHVFDVPVSSRQIGLQSVPDFWMTFGWGIMFLFPLFTFYIWILAHNRLPLVRIPSLCEIPQRLVGWENVTRTSINMKFQFWTIPLTLHITLLICVGFMNHLWLSQYCDRCRGSSDGSCRC